MHKRAWSSVSVAVAGVLLAGQTAHARAPGASGRPDTTFGDRGFSQVEFPGDLTVGGPVVVQPDGKVVTAFSSQGRQYPAHTTPRTPPREFVGLARFGNDGRLDRSFGDRGVVRTTGVLAGRDSGASEPLRFEGVAVTDLVRQSDGALLLAGTLAGRAAVLRYLPNGQLDSSFGVGGLAYVSPDFRGRMRAIGLLPDGIIIGVASVSTGVCVVPLNYACFIGVGAGDPMRVVKFSPSGIPVAVVPSDPRLPMAVEDLVVAGDGSIVLAGAYFEQFAIMRLTALGLPDRSFGARGDGIVVSPVHGATSRALGVTTVGTDVVATGASPEGYGECSAPANQHCAVESRGRLVLARYSARGVPVKSFGTGGRILASARGVNLSGNAVVATRDGLVVAGTQLSLMRTKKWQLEPGIRRGLLARFTAQGQLDRRFGAKGMTVVGTSMRYHGWLFNGLALDTHQRIVVAGTRSVDRKYGPPAFVRLLVGRFLQMSDAG